MLVIFAMPYLYLCLSPIISGYILIHYTKRTMQSLCLCIHVYLLRFPHFHINMNVKWYRTICIVKPCSMYPYILIVITRNKIAWVSNFVIYLRNICSSFNIDYYHQHLLPKGREMSNYPSLLRYCVRSSSSSPQNECCCLVFVTVRK